MNQTDRARTGAHARAPRGFSMVELTVFMVLLVLVIGAVAAVINTAAKSKTSTLSRLESSAGGRAVMELLTRDLTNAGYAVDADYVAAPQAPIAYVDSVQILISADLNEPASTSAGTTKPDAYDPDGTPRPYPLMSSAWTPPIKYRTGAEIIRWTLDVNNDGVVDGDDRAGIGADAARTPNPNDYVLVRQVYGDSAYSGTNNNNAGYTEAVALVRAPGGTTPAIFTVYMQGSSTPYNWSSGPVPPGELSRIERIVVNVTATAGRPNAKNQYPDTKMRTEVRVERNVPDFGEPLYAVQGYVFEDLNGDQVKNTGEPGIANAGVQLGPYFYPTTGTGYFIFNVKAGTYTLSHSPAIGYSTIQSPATYSVTVPPATTKTFADVSIPGGMVSVQVFQDLNGNGVLDAGEPWKADVPVDLSPSGDSKVTDDHGSATLFAGVGAYTVTVTPPDSFVASTTNPASGTMVDNGTTSHTFGLAVAELGNVEGLVFDDLNKNGVMDSGEPGLDDVWVGVKTSDGTTTVGYAYTNASGEFSVEVDANSDTPDEPYYVTLISPSGYYPTTTTWLGPVLVPPFTVVSNQNFGLAGFRIITLNASNLLSLASGDLIEKDMSGVGSTWATGGRRDVDLIMGVDQSTSNNISVWFNQYNSTTLFTSTPTYTRTSLASVMSIAVDSMNTATPTTRPDVVVGTKNNTTGNWFLWLNEDTPDASLGYLKTAYSRAYKTTDAGDVQAVVTTDCAGNSLPDVIVGTKNLTYAGRGSMEVWQNGEGATPAFTRVETYPTAGGLASNSLGEVRAMTLADLDGDGRRDLIVGTNKATNSTTYSGQVIVFKNVSNTTGNRFIQKFNFYLPTDAATSLAVGDFDADGWPDIAAGTQWKVDKGRILIIRNQQAPVEMVRARPTAMTPVTMNLAVVDSVECQGIVLSVAAADMGGAINADLIVGWREKTTTYLGGALIYYMDGFYSLGGSGRVRLATSPTDPSGGSLTSVVSTMTVNNFNYGVNPTVPYPPYLMDVALGVKLSATTGQIMILQR